MKKKNERNQFPNGIEIVSVELLDSSKGLLHIRDFFIYKILENESKKPNEKYVYNIEDFHLVISYSKRSARVKLNESGQSWFVFCPPKPNKLASKRLQIENVLKETEKANNNTKIPRRRAEINRETRRRDR